MSADHDAPTPADLRGLLRSSYGRSHAPVDVMPSDQAIADLAQTANAAVQDLHIALDDLPDGLVGVALLECARLADSLNDLQRRLRDLGAEIVA